MTSILDKITQYNVPAPAPIAPTLHEHKECNELDHDALHCPWCSTDRKILQALATQVGIMQHLLDKFEDAEGVPHGTPFNFSQASPVQNTVYISPQTLLTGVVRSLLVGGPGNVTLKLQEPRNQIYGGLTICTLPCNGAALSVPHRFIIPVGSTLTLSTDASAGTGLLTVSAWVEPVTASSSEFFAIRR